MAYIGKTPVIGNFVKLDSITAVNGQAAYTMQNGGVNFTSYDNVNQFLVSLNGVLQAPTDSFTVSSSTLTFASNLSTGDVIDFVLVLGNSLDIGTPSDNTVTAAKIVDGAITSAKLGSGVGGKVLQVVSTTKTDTFEGANGDTWYTVTGLTASITPSSTSNKVLISGFISGSSQNTSDRRRLYVKIQRGGSDLSSAIGDSAGSRLQIHSINYSNGGADSVTIPFQFLDSPSSTSALSYSIQVRDDTDGVNINKSASDDNNDTYFRSVSTITAMEISA